VTWSSIADGAGFVGAVVILGGYAWQSLRQAAPDLPYHLANLFGAVLLAFSLMINYNLPALCLEVAWSLVSLVGLVRFMRSL
jgi:hypothetical protein